MRFYDRKEDEKIEERGQYAAQYLDRVNLASLSGTRQNLDRGRYTAGPCCPLGSQSGKSLRFASPCQLARASHAI